MISEGTLRSLCSPAVMSRAYYVAERGVRLHERTCSYEGKYTTISAVIDGTYSYSGQYRTKVVLDEEHDGVVSYSCTCPAAQKYEGPCKHAIALVLDFNDNPQEYAGYNETSHVTTSRSIARYLEKRTQRTATTAGAQTEGRSGTVRLELTLSYSGTGFDARFQVGGERGSYVLKSLGDFVDAVVSRSYHKYGKRLAFTHVPDAFVADSQPVVAFLVRAVRNRRSFALERAAGRVGVGSYHSTLRDLHLSVPELEELLNMYQGRSLMFEDKAASGSAHPRRLEVAAGDPPVSLELVEVGGNGSYELVRHGDSRIVVSGGICLAWDHSHLWRCTSKLAPVADFLAAVYGDPSEHLLIGEHDIPAFCASTLPALESAVSVSAPEQLEQLRPQPCLLEFFLDYTKKGATCLAVARYGQKRYALFGDRGAAERDLSRDAATEGSGRAVVTRYFPVSNGGRLCMCGRGDDALATAVYEGVPELRLIGQVYATPAFEALRSHAHPTVRMGVSVRSNLVNLSLQTSDLAPGELHALLASYRLKKHYHRLSDGSILDLSKLDLDEVSQVADELGLSQKQLEAGQAEIPSYKAFLLDNLMDEDQKDASFESYLEGFRSVDASAYEVPAKLHATLRPYQVSGYQWLSALCDMGFGGILADEMGLGKSVQLISLIVARLDEARKVGPSLIVCPASLVYNWQAEFQKFAPHVKVQVVAGSVAERHDLRAHGDFDVMVTSYDLLRRDIQEYASMPLWCAVLDEAQYIKNHETLAARAVKHLNAVHRFALSGTPIENRLSELWSIFDFLMPGLLGSYERFRDRYERPIVEGHDEATSARLRAAVGPFILRRLKSDVLRDLPEKLEQVVYARMDDEQSNLYAANVQQLRESLGRQSAEDFGRSKMQVLAALTRLREICCDPRLVFDNYDGGSCKMDAIMELVEQAVDSGAKMLVFSQFTSYLDLIAEELDRRAVSYYTITGATPKRRRLELVDAFNADDTPVFLISLKAGGTGLNLTGASIVLHADPWWNAAAQNQATDRAHRIGQKKNVTVYRVIAKGTIEERILELQDQKSALADEVVGEGAGMSLSSLTRDDLEELLS